jgi:hypothetical protein
MNRKTDNNSADPSKKRNREFVRKSDVNSFFDNELLPKKMPVDLQVIKKATIQDLYHPSDSKDDSSIPITVMDQSMIDSISTATDAIDDHFHARGVKLTYEDLDEEVRETMPYVIPKDHYHDFIDVNNDVFTLIFNQLKENNRSVDFDIYNPESRLNLIRDARAVSALQSSSEFRMVDTHMQLRISDANFNAKPLKFDLGDHVFKMKEELSCKCVSFYIRKYEKKQIGVRIVFEYSMGEKQAFVLCEGVSLVFQTNEDLPQMLKEATSESRIIVREIQMFNDLKKTIGTFAGYCFLFCGCKSITGK